MDLSDIGFWLSSAYSHLIATDQRQRLAMHFTPPVLGERMLDDMEAAGLDWTSAKIVDIACGGAAFLAPAARRIAGALVRRSPKIKAESVLAHVEMHVCGIDIEPFLASLSRYFVRLALYPWIEAAGRLPKIQIITGDALRKTKPLLGQFDAVICNPPYRKLASAEVAALPKNLRPLCHMQPNLYAMFMGLAVQLLSPRGIAGLLTPMSFISGRSFERLRHYLTQQHHITHIDLVEEKKGVFLGVEQHTAITVLAPRTTGRSAKRSATSVFVGAYNGTWQAAGKVVLSAQSGPWVLPRSPHDAQLLGMVNCRTYADYGYAMVVGSVVLHRDDRPRYATLAQAHKAKAGHPAPMLRASEILTNGQIQFCRAPRPDCYIDVSEASSDLVACSAIALHRVTSDDQPRRLIGAEVPPSLQLQHGGVLGENHVSFLVAKNGSAVAPALLVKILGSEPVDRLFRCRSGVTNVSEYELGQLPLPDPDLVQQSLDAGANIDAAVLAGYGI